jgi:hypothetical protein
MESTSMTGMIQCSAAFIRLLQQQWPQSVELAVAQVRAVRCDLIPSCIS